MLKEITKILYKTIIQNKVTLCETNRILLFFVIGCQMTDEGYTSQIVRKKFNIFTKREERGG